MALAVVDPAVKVVADPAAAVVGPAATGAAQVVIADHADPAVIAVATVAAIALLTWIWKSSLPIRSISTTKPTSS